LNVITPSLCVMTWASWPYWITSTGDANSIFAWNRSVTCQFTTQWYLFVQPALTFKNSTIPHNIVYVAISLVWFDYPTISRQVPIFIT
jgi:hypothetical protein